jgi:hypothetical protein
MKRSLKNLVSYTIQSIDEPKGRVRDFLFDEESWIIRYLDADFGNIFKNKRVLIPRVFLNQPDWDQKIFPIDLKKENIQSCPDLDDRKPVSREYERALSEHYSIDHYWPYYYPAGAAMYFPPRPLIPPNKKLDEKDLDTSLRSFTEVTDYHTNAIDGKIGHLEDIIVDDADWQIVYIIVDTSNWVPWSKKVILPIDCLLNISYVNKEVEISLLKDIIKASPESDSIHQLDLDYEKALYDFYDKSFVK